MPATHVQSRESSGARQRIVRVQRARILTALVDVCAERGVSRLTVGEIVGHAGISRRTFYELFDDSEDCLLAALDDATARAAALVVEAYEGSTRWRERIRAALTALLRFLDEQPEIATLLIVESLGAGPRALERRARVLDKLIAAVDGGRAEAKSAAALPALSAEGLVGAALAVIHARIARTERDRPAAAPRLGELVNPLMSMIVLPYLGAAAARKEAEQPAPAAPRARRPRSKPFAGLGMRVTYRTMHVLAAIEELGGRGSYPSNRQVGHAAGIDDQGQMSKLLARLKRVELIENVSEEHVKGAPNAWRLTTKGSEFLAAIEPHPSLSEPDAP
jgi:AcrR family transcriptional regulator